MNVPDSSSPPAVEIQDRHLLQFLLDHTPDRIYFKDRDSRFMRVSRALSSLFRAAGPEALLGKTDFDFFTPEHAQPAFDDEQEIIRTGQPLLGKVEKETLPDGRFRWVLTSKMPLRNPDGAIVGTCGISKDMTVLKEMEDALKQSNDALTCREAELERALAELKTAQQQLIEAEKIQSIARLASGVAHEIRNPLNILNMGIAYLAEETSRDEDAAVILKEMREAVQRADAVICALMDSSRPTNLNLEAADIREIIAQALVLVAEPLARKKITVHQNFAEALPFLRLDRDKMQGVFGGILLNAIEAMSDSGTLTIRGRLIELTAGDIEREAGARSGARLRSGEKVVAVEVEDDGPGIPPESLPKIFDAFFTTKETGVGTGTGLGLTVCRKILELHESAMEVSNRREGGVKATILLRSRPSADGKADGPGTAGA